MKEYLYQILKINNVMIYFVIRMIPYRFINTFIIVSLFLLTAGTTTSYSQNHIKELDALRSSMAEIGAKMPDMIRATKNNEMRTLERVYEINTYALTTIEAYFKMVKVAVSSDGKINTDIIAVFNGWLQFISKYCEQDISYLDEATLDMKNPDILKLLALTKSNITALDRIAAKAIEENNNLLKKK
jgi:hypothetical protein